MCLLNGWRAMMGSMETTTEWPWPDPRPVTDNYPPHGLAGLGWVEHRAEWRHVKRFTLTALEGGGDGWRLLDCYGTYFDGPAVSLFIPDPPAPVQP